MTDYCPGKRDEWTEGSSGCCTGGGETGRSVGRDFTETGRSAV